MKRQLFYIALFITNLAWGQEFDQQRMDSLFHYIESSEKGMGSLSIFKDGQKAYEKAIGYANINQKVAATPKTKYRIGSISKTFTATIIMQLVQENKLELSTYLEAFFPEVPNADKINIDQLLRHQSGIFNFTSDKKYLNYMEKPMSRENLLNKISSYESVFEPGTKAEYSNSNYVLLSMIIEKIEGKQFADVLTDRICKPCNLGDTYYGQEISDAREEAYSYTWDQTWKDATETDMSLPMGAGALVSTPNDLNRFLNCLFDHQLVSEATLNQMTDLKDGMGAGLFQVPFYEKRGFGHNGGIDGFQTASYYFPEDEVAISYFSNGVVMAVNNVMIGALSIFYGRDYQFPDFTPALKLPSEALDQYLGVYSGPSFPMKITISKKGNSLMGQATGQPSFPLEAFAQNQFRYEAAGIKLEFKPDENQMILRQAGRDFVLNRE